MSTDFSIVILTIFFLISTYCLCGNSYGSYGSSSNCNMPCSGNTSEICGGVMTNSIYSTKCFSCRSLFYEIKFRWVFF